MKECSGVQGPTLENLYLVEAGQVITSWKGFSHLLEFGEAQ